MKLIRKALWLSVLFMVPLAGRAQISPSGIVIGSPITGTCTNGFAIYNNSGVLGCEAVSGVGTVTSVNGSGGTTGLTVTGGPITAAGTLTLGGTLAVASGGTGTATPALVAGTNITITGSWPNQTINSSGGGSSAFSSLTSGTNTTAAMVVGSGATLAASGSGTIGATSAPVSGLTGAGTGVVTALGNNANATSGLLTQTATLTANGLLLGGGSGTGVGVLGSLGTTTTLLHGNAAGAPTFSAVSLSADVTGSLALTSLASQAANTVVANVTAGSAAPTAASLPSCPDTGGNHLNYTTGGTAFTCGTSSSGGGSLTVTDGTHSVASTTTLTVPVASLLVGGSAGSATLTPVVTDTTHTTSATTANTGGQDDYNGSSITATLATLAAGQTALVTDQNSTALTIGNNSQTVNGLPLSTTLHNGGFYSYSYNTTTSQISGFGFPGFGTITTNSIGKFLDGTGAMAASGLSDNGTTISTSEAVSLSGLLTTAASAAGGAGINLPQGSAPTSPSNGDLWTTSGGLYVRIAGTTVGPLAAGGTASSITPGTTTISGATAPCFIVNSASTTMACDALGTGVATALGNATNGTGGLLTQPGAASNLLLKSGGTTAAPAASNVTDNGNTVSIASGALTAPVALTDGASIAVNAYLTNSFTLTLTANGHTMAAPTNPTAGQWLDFVITGAGNTMSWNAAYTWAAGSAPTLNASGATEIACKTTAATPTLICFGPTNSAVSQSSVASPTAPASTSAYKMQGLAGTITPATTGNIEITISGTIIAPTATTVNNGISYQISYGTGGAPANAATLTGTQVGTIQTYTSAIAPTAAADVHVPFSHTAIVTGLTPGTTYWIDEAAESVTNASDMALSAVSISVREIR